VVVSDNAITGAPHILPISELMSREYRKHDLKIHLICGGGSGSRLMRLLAIEGYQVSVGVLNAGDTDHQLAKSLGMEVIEESSFSHISDEAHNRNVEQVRASDVVVLSRVPIGVGNLKNIIAARTAMEAGVRVILLGDFDGMDYTDGEATAIFDGLRSSGAVAAKDESEALSIIMSSDNQPSDMM